MRLTVWEAMKQGEAERYKVFLDGKELRGCFEADEEAGVARCWKTDEQGRVIADFDENGNLETVECHGKVELVRIVDVAQYS